MSLCQRPATGGGEVGGVEERAGNTRKEEGGGGGGGRGGGGGGGVGGRSTEQQATRQGESPAPALREKCCSLHSCTQMDTMTLSSCLGN